MRATEEIATIVEQIKLDTEDRKKRDEEARAEEEAKEESKVEQQKEIV